MFPQIGQHVKCVFKTGFIAEGIVEEWSPQGAKLLSIDKKSYLLIVSPSQDLMLIKIIFSTIEKNNETYSIEKNNSTIDPFNPDYNKNLAQLYREKAEQDRKILIEKIREHRPSISAPKVTYEQPRFSTKPSLK